MREDAAAEREADELRGLPCREEYAASPAWKARWISLPGVKPENYYFLARQRFSIAKLPQAAILRVAADSRYAVYVNGRFVGNGPARGTHRRYFFDSYDVAGYLNAGENWIAAEVHCPVRATFTMAPNAPALLAEVAGLVASDAAWQVRQDPSHRADAPLYTFQIGFSEWKELPAELADWQTGKGGAGWQSAVEIGTPKDFGGRVAVARPISGLTSDALRPASVADFGRVPGLRPGNLDPEYAARMAAEEHRPPEPAQFQHLSALTGGDGVATIQPSREGDGAYAIFDFGREVLGHLVADIEAAGQSVMDVGYVEYLSEKRANFTPVNTSYRFADRFVLREGRQVVSPRLHSRGCRYVQIVLRNFGKPVRIHSLRFQNRVYSCEPRASFTCSDPFLDRLWQMCVNTIRMCSSDTFMDCPSREQAFWLNDQAVTNLMYLALTGDRVFAAHNLRVGADGALPNGLIPAVYPSAREAPLTHFPIMPSLWTWSLSDYYACTGDGATLKELLPRMRDALRLYDRWRDEDGLVPNQPGMWNFIDWGYGKAMLPDQVVPGKTAALNMAIAAAYKCAAQLEMAAGEERPAEAYAARSRDTVSALGKVLWDDEKGWYRDCTVGEGSGTASQHPLAIGLAFDLLGEPQRSRAQANLLHPDLIQAELYFQHYVLKSLMRQGRAAEALGVIRRLWGPMVAADSYTVWESKLGSKAWDGAGSLCHGFSCAPIYAMQAGILGVWPLQPGFRTFAWRPQPGGLAAAEGEIPTPLGMIRTSWRRQGQGQLKAEITFPQGARAVLASGEVLEAGTHSLDAPLTSACP